MIIVEDLWYVESDDMVGFDDDGQPEFRPCTTGPFHSKQKADQFAKLVNGTVRPGRDINPEFLVETREVEA